MQPNLPRLRSIDLNLLPVLRQLLARRNVTHAARELGLSQPAASKALSRLRAILGDPLLVRDGRRLILTPRAEMLLPVVEEECQRLEMLWLPNQFDPVSSTREFKIAATDYEALALLPELAPVLRRDAPCVSLSFATLHDDLTTQQCIEVDLVIAAEKAIAHLASDEIAIVPLWSEEFVTVVGPNHPLSQERHMPGGVHTRQLAFRPDASSRELFAEMEPLMPANPMATLPTFTILPILALLTDTAAYVPRMVATRFAQFLPLTILESAGPAWPINICMAWHHRWNEDRGHRWLREQIGALGQNDIHCMSKPDEVP